MIEMPSAVGPVTLAGVAGISSEDYHGSDAISHSKLEVFRERPLLYWKRFVTKSLPREESPAFAVGSALHCLSLEPAKYAEGFVMKPEGIDRRTTAGKAAWAQFCAENDGKTVLDSDQTHAVGRMAGEIHAHPIAQKLLARGQPELTWRKPSTALGRDLQCRTDWFNSDGCELTEGRPYVADVKTIDRLDDRNAFQKAFVNFGYHRQCGFYLPLLEDCGVVVRDFFFIVVEKCEPFGCIVYNATPDAIARGQDETVSDLVRLVECQRKDVWPNLPTDLREINLPDWYK